MMNPNYSLMAIINNRVRTIMFENLLNQNQFAFSIHMNDGTLSRYLNANNDRVFPVEYLVEIARVYHVSLDWICGLTDVR